MQDFAAIDFETANGQRAYRAIPFERSAYRLEGRKNLRPLTMAFDWLRCLRGK